MIQRAIIALKALEIAKECKDLRGEAVTLLISGNLKIKINDSVGAEADLLRSYEISMDIDETRNAMQASQYLYALFKKQNRDKNTIYYLERFKALSDSLFNESNAQETARLQAEYEFNQEKKQLIVDQEKEELVLQNELKRQKIIQYAAFGGVILFLLLFISFYISYRRKKRDNQVISSQKQKLEDLSQFKEGLTHMIAHDMKNSLNTILGFSASEPYDKKMKGISQSGQVLLNLVTNMLDVQRFEETEVSLDIKLCNPKQIVEEARLQVALLFQMKSLRLEIAIQKHQDVPIDKELMVRVLVNLLNNAVKYSKPGSLIRLSVDHTIENDKSFCQFIVSDEGEGIETEKLPYIFDKFWKDSAKAYDPMASTGLGLTFCKLAIEGHEGRINVESEIGSGTTFYVNLPIEAIHDVKANTTTTKYIVGQDEELILERERKVLEALAIKLKTLEVYQVGEINALLKNLEDEHIESRWKQSLENTIFKGDESAYEELIQQFKS